MCSPSGARTSSPSSEAITMETRDVAIATTTDHGTTAEIMNTISEATEEILGSKGRSLPIVVRTDTAVIGGSPITGMAMEAL